MAHLLNHNIAYYGGKNTEIADAIQVRNNTEVYRTEDLLSRGYN